MRLRLYLTMLATLIGCAGCDEPDTAPKDGLDQQTCLTAEVSPVDALTACSRFIWGADPRSSFYSSAYYNRGVAFATIEEYQHARLDFVRTLEIDPKNRWARQRLQDIDEKLSRGGRSNIVN